MELTRTWRIILSITIIVVAALIIAMGVVFWQAWRSSPTLQFSQARHRWESSSLVHYRMVASYYDNFSQCYYDVEVQQDQIVHTFSQTCMSSAPSKTLTISGIFKEFEKWSTGQVCSPNGCSCEGMYILHATYDPALGYPLSITTVFNRNLVYDFLHGELGRQQCLRTDPIVELVDRIKVSPLP